MTSVAGDDFRTPMRAPTTSTSAAWPASKLPIAPSRSRTTARHCHQSSRASSGRWPANTAGELSAKVFAGACRHAELGHPQGGRAAYGLRRAIVDPHGGIKMADELAHIGPNGLAVRMRLRMRTG